MPDFVVWIVAVCTIGWLANNWIKAKHGYPLDDGAGGRIEKTGNNEETKRLRDENRHLRDQLENVSDRMVVLERIITDKGYELSEQIERLRDREESR